MDDGTYFFIDFEDGKKHGKENMFYRNGNKLQEFNS
jgi:hypothetical protein